MADTPRETEEPTHNSSSMASRDASEKEGADAGRGITGPTAKDVNDSDRKVNGGAKQTIRLIYKGSGASQTPIAKTPQTGRSSRLENPLGNSSPDLTREIARNAKAKHKENSLIRRSFHNPDGSLRGMGMSSTSQAQTPVSGSMRTQVANITQARTPISNSARYQGAIINPQAQTLDSAQGRVTSDPRNTPQTGMSHQPRSREGVKFKDDEWRYKVRGSVTSENAIEVFEKTSPLISVESYPRTEANMGEGGGRSRGSGQKLPPVVTYKHSPHSSSSSMAIGSFTRSNSGSSVQSRFPAHNAVEIRENDPQPKYEPQPGYEQGLVHPDLLIEDAERFGHRPPLKDKIWFTPSPFRIAPLFESMEKTTNFVPYCPPTTYFTTSYERGTIEVESTDTTLDVAMEMEKAYGTHSQGKRKILRPKSRKGAKGVKLMSGGHGSGLLGEKSNEMHHGDHTYQSTLYGDQTARGNDSGFMEMAAKERTRALSPRFL